MMLYKILFFMWMSSQSSTITSGNPLERDLKEWTIVAGDGHGPSFTNKTKPMLPVDTDESSASVPEVREFFEGLVAAKNRIKLACNHLTRRNPNSEVTRAICRILIGEVGIKLQSILRQNEILLTPMLPKEKQLRRVVSKRVDGSILKFPLRQRTRPRMTLHEAIYLAYWICPQLMKTGDAGIADVCWTIQLEAKILVQPLRGFDENVMRKMGQ